MKNPLKRWDVAATLVIFLMMIPAERFESFSMLEDQTISYRHILRSALGPDEFTKLRDEIIIVALDESLYDEYGSFPFRRTDIGVIAQEIEEIIPEVVKEVETLNTDGETHKVVDYAKLSSVSIKAIQEQQEQINELKEKLNG